MVNRPSAVFFQASRALALRPVFQSCSASWARTSKPERTRTWTCCGRRLRFCNSDPSVVGCSSGAATVGPGPELGRGGAWPVLPVGSRAGSVSGVSLRRPPLNLSLVASSGLSATQRRSFHQLQKRQRPHGHVGDPGAVPDPAARAPHGAAGLHAGLGLHAQVGEDDRPEPLGSSCCCGCTGLRWPPGGVIAAALCWISPDESWSGSGSSRAGGDSPAGSCPLLVRWLLC